MLLFINGRRMLYHIKSSELKSNNIAETIEDIWGLR